jgi:hypothetical protein
MNPHDRVTTVTNDGPESAKFANERFVRNHFKETRRNDPE